MVSFIVSFLFCSCVTNSKSALVSETDKGNHVNNWVKSINTKNEVVKGKNKVCDLYMSFCVTECFVHY